MEIEPVDPSRELVSVVVPAYDAAATLRETVESALAQSYRNLEVIVVDDGSRDGTAAVAEAVAAGDTRVRLVRKPNGGLGSARNAGIAQANGSYIAMLDADDLWHPEKIARQMVVMRRGGPRLALVYTWHREIDETGRIVSSRMPPRSTGGDPYPSLVLSNFVGPGSTALIRKACILEVGGFDERACPGCEDLKLYLALAERFEFASVPEFLVGYRRWDRSMSRNEPLMRTSQYSVLADARRRHPELPGRLFRRAKSGVCSAHGLQLLREGSYWRGLYLLLFVVPYDPGLLLQAEFYRTAFRAVGRLGRRALGRPVPRTGAEHDRSCGQPFYVAPPEPDAGCDTATAGWLMAQRWVYASSLRIQRPLSAPASAVQDARAAHV